MFVDPFSPKVLSPPLPHCAVDLLHDRPCVSRSPRRSTAPPPQRRSQGPTPRSRNHTRHLRCSTRFCMSTRTALCPGPHTSATPSRTHVPVCPATRSCSTDPTPQCHSQGPTPRSCSHTRPLRCSSHCCMSTLPQQMPLRSRLWRRPLPVRASSYAFYPSEQGDKNSCGCVRACACACACVSAWCQNF